MMRRARPRLHLAAVLVIAANAAPLVAQSWQTETNSGAPGRAPAAASQPPHAPMPTDLPANTTIVPRSPEQRTPPPAVGGGAGQVTLSAVLTEDGQAIERGLVWRVFRDKPGSDGKPQLVAKQLETTPTLRLEPGMYVVNVAFGRANLTRRITIAGGASTQERFVLNAGGLRIVPVLTGGEAINEKAVSYDIYSDERDQYGQRIKVTSGMKPGVVVRLNSGIYNVVSSYGDANAVARADVTVEAGKLTEATLSHAAGKATFKLVARAGGEAFADTQWTIANLQGETVKESVGALPTHILAPGTYMVSAKNAGEVFRRNFTLQAGESVEVELVRR
jgi:hypothetical protein